MYTELCPDGTARGDRGGCATPCLEDGECDMPAWILFLVSSASPSAFHFAAEGTGMRGCLTPWVTFPGHATYEKEACMLKGQL
jgi:hypothetical protein